MLPVVTACLVLAAPAPKSDLSAAAARYSELMPGPVPADASNEYRYRVAQLEALVTFVQKNASVFTSGAVSDREFADFAANFIQAERDTFAALKKAGFPLGLTESYRVQAGLHDAFLRHVRAVNGFQLPPQAAKQDALFALPDAYAKVAAEKQPTAK